MTSLGSLFWAMLAFGLVFSCVVLLAGTRRLLGASKENRRLEAMFWGAVGFALGLTGVIVTGVFAYRTLRAL